MPYATVADIEARWRPLTADEQTIAPTLLEDAENMLRLRLPTLDDRLSAGELPATLVASVVVAPVIRHLRNPDGFTTERIGDYSYTRPEGGVTLVLTAEDLERLAIGGSGAFTIRPAGTPHIPVQDLWL